MKHKWRYFEDTACFTGLGRDLCIYMYTEPLLFFFFWLTSLYNQNIGPPRRNRVADFGFADNIRAKNI
jgi:hypothetical protein